MFISTNYCYCNCQRIRWSAVYLFINILNIMCMLMRTSCIYSINSPTSIEWSQLVCLCVSCDFQSGTEGSRPPGRGGRQPGDIPPPLHRQPELVQSLHFQSEALVRPAFIPSSVSNHSSRPTSMLRLFTKEHRKVRRGHNSMFLYPGTDWQSK